MFPASIITFLSTMSQTEYRVAKKQSGIKSQSQFELKHLSLDSSKSKLFEVLDHVHTAAENGFHFCI